MFKRLQFLILFLILSVSSVFAGFVNSYNVAYNTTTETSTMILKGDIHITSNTIDGIPATSPVELHSTGADRMILREGYLHLTDSSSYIKFYDGSLQNTAGVGSAGNVSNNSDAIIVADADDSGAGDILFKIYNTEYMRVDNAGNIGIGTTNPTEKLDIYNGAIEVGYVTDTYDELISFRRGGATLGVLDSSNNELGLRARNNKSIHLTDDSSNGITVEDGGNIGIGTTNPTVKLEVYGDIKSTGTLIGLADIAGGEIDGTVIGANSASTGEFTTIVASTITAKLIGDVAGDLTGIAFGTFKRIDSQIVSVATTTINISGLAGNTDIEYKLIINTVKSTATADVTEIRMTFNDNSTGVYTLKGLNASGAGISDISVIAGNYFFIGHQNNSNSLFGSYGIINIYSKLNNNWRIVLCRHFSGSSPLREWGGVFEDSTNEITSIKLTSSITDGFGAGTTVELYARR